MVPVVVAAEAEDAALDGAAALEGGAVSSGEELDMVVCTAVLASTDCRFGEAPPVQATIADATSASDATSGTRRRTRGPNRHVNVPRSGSRITRSGVRGGVVNSVGNYLRHMNTPNQHCWRLVDHSVCRKILDLIHVFTGPGDDL
jgi:hypothetical protein